MALAALGKVEVKGIVANCKLAPKADSMLHLVIADIMSSTDAMAGKHARVRPVDGLAKVAQAVDPYGKHFDPPGCSPRVGFSELRLVESAKALARRCTSVRRVACRSLTDR